MRWTCSRCGQEHVGLPFDWAFDTPIYWDGGRGKEDFISEDLCIWTDDAGDKNFFIRGVLYLPVVDAERRFGYGVWSSLSEKSFNRAYELWDDSKRVEEPPYFGWLSNSLPGYPETLSLPMDVVVQEVDLRPSFVLHPGDHPLIAEQQNGITTERVREIAELQMH